MKNLIYGLIGFSAVAFAQDGNLIVIKQIHLEQKWVAAETTKALTVGAELFATFADNKQCVLKVTSLQDKLATLDSSQCARANELTVGQKLEPSLVVVAPVAPKIEKIEVVIAPEKQEAAPSPVADPLVTDEKSDELDTPVVRRADKIRVSVYGYSSSANQVKFKSFSASGGGVSARGEATFETDSAGGIGAEIGVLRPDNWGWAFGFTVDPKRDITSGAVDAEGIQVNVNYLNPKPTLQFYTVYANAVYRWTQFYIPFGLNHSFPTLNRGIGAPGTFDVKGAMGGQLGVGFHVNDNFRVELVDRVVAFSVKATNAPYSYDYGTGYYTGMQLIFKATFD